MNNMEQYILAIDQGTSGTKAVLFDTQGRIVSKASVPLKSFHPKPGIAEQNPEEIFQTVLQSVEQCLINFPGDWENIVSCGISNQRETFILWDWKGTPLHNAVVWHCKRSVEICNRLKFEGYEDEINKRTGLIIDPYFSGTKVIWLNEMDSKVHEAIRTGRAYFGTVDTWLLYKLTYGLIYYTDYTNASRTLFFNIHDLDWDRKILEKFGLGKINLPAVNPSAFDYGSTDFNGIFKKKIPISALIGDSHAAAFGEGLFASGEAKATLGTGSSILVNTENKILSSGSMMTTICWSTRDRIDYALEGVIVTCGATINWLRDKLALFEHSCETEELAKQVSDNGGVYLVPAFSGLGAPYWKMDLKAAITGLTFACDKRHIVRAALESIAYQIKDVFDAMKEETGLELKELKVDGGITANKFVLQFLSDLLNRDVVNIGIEDVSALGAALLAGLESGIYESVEEIKSIQNIKKQFTPGENLEIVKSAHLGWKNAINKML